MENLLAGKLFCGNMQVMQNHEDTGSLAHVDPNILLGGNISYAMKMFAST